MEVNEFGVALFRRATEPKTEFEEVAFAPAGSMRDQKVAGRAKIDDIMLEKGVLPDGSDTAALDWIKQEVDVNAVTGQLPDEYMRDIDIVRHDRAGQETRRWTLHGAWIKVLEYDTTWKAETRRMASRSPACATSIGRSNATATIAAGGSGASRRPDQPAWRERISRD